MKKLMIILLIGMLSLGLSGVAFAADGSQVVGATIDTAVAINTLDDVTSWALTNGTDDTYQFLVTVDANCPYSLTVKSAADARMTGNDTAETDLANDFELKYDSTVTDHSVTSPGTTLSLSTVTTSGGTAPVLFAALEAPADGQDAIGVGFSQLTEYGDPAYEATTQITYSITLTWTAATTIS